jgi:hypothetical protein
LEERDAETLACLLWGTPPRGIAMREIGTSSDSNCLPVKKKLAFSDFLTPAVAFRRGGGGDRRRLQLTVPWAMFRG